MYYMLKVIGGEEPKFKWHPRHKWNPGKGRYVGRHANQKCIKHAMDLCEELSKTVEVREYDESDRHKVVMILHADGTMEQL